MNRIKMICPKFFIIVLGFLSSCSLGTNDEEQCCQYRYYRAMLEDENCHLPAALVKIQLGTRMQDVLKQHTRQLHDATYVPEIEDTTHCVNDRIFKATYFIGKSQLAKCSETLVFCEQYLIRQSMEIRQNRPTSLTLEAFREELELEKTLYFFNLITFLKPGDSIEYKTECERATFSLNKIKAFEEEIEWQFSIKSEILISEVDSDTL